jgi:integrase/recombinase XerD
MPDTSTKHALPSLIQLSSLPGIIRLADAKAQKRFVEFFTATIRNRNTREAYARAIRSFLDWCEAHKVTELIAIQPVMVAAYIEDIGTAYSKPTVKQSLAAIRMLFDWLVTGQIVEVNPAWSVRGPKHVIKRGKTPVLTAEETRQLIDSIDCSTISGLRDRALIGVMVYSFSRVSAAIGMNVEHYYSEGRRTWFRLHEKGGKEHCVPAHHKAEEYLDAYLQAMPAVAAKDEPLFRTVGRNGELTTARMTRNDALRMVKRRGEAAGITSKLSPHSFRATGITEFLLNGGTVENAMAIAAHESPRTTKLYDRRNDEITLDEIERIRI